LSRGLFVLGLSERMSQVASTGADKVCGTFQLPSGESFNYKAGHWWRYNSDQEMQAQWTEHVALYQQKSENAGCSIGQRP